MQNSNNQFLEEAEPISQDVQTSEASDGDDGFTAEIPQAPDLLNYFQKIQDLTTKNTLTTEQAKKSEAQISQNHFDKKFLQSANQLLRQYMNTYSDVLRVQQMPGFILQLNQIQQNYRHDFDHAEKEIAELLENAGLQKKQTPKPAALQDKVVSNFLNGDQPSQEPSDDFAMDSFDRILQNKDQIKTQYTELAQLRAVVRQNEKKLRTWAKVKSKQFRRIHNKEKKESRMKYLMDKLQKYQRVSEAIGLDDVAQDFIKDQERYAEQQKLDNEELLERQEIIDEEQVMDSNKLTQLGFMKRYLKGMNNIIEDDKDKLLKQQQVYGFEALTQKEKPKISQIDEYEQNPFLDSVQVKTKEQFNEEEEEKRQKMQQLRIRTQKQSSLLKPKTMIEELKEKLTTPAQNIVQQEIVDCFNTKEFSELKQQEAAKDVTQQEVLQGWGTWAGVGAPDKDKRKVDQRKQSSLLQYNTKVQENFQKRKDASKPWLYVNQETPNEIIDKYAARGIRIDADKYSEYIRQGITEQFQSATGARYARQESVQMQRGVVDKQEREMDQNARELQKLQKQLEQQRNYVKGKANIGAARRQAKF